MSTAECTDHQNGTTSQTALVVQIGKLNEIFADVSTRVARLRALSEQLDGDKSKISY